MLEFHEHPHYKAHFERNVFDSFLMFRKTSSGFPQKKSCHLRITLHHSNSIPQRTQSIYSDSQTQQISCLVFGVNICLS